MLLRLDPKSRWPNFNLRAVLKLKHESQVINKRDLGAFRVFFLSLFTFTTDKLEFVRFRGFLELELKEDIASFYTFDALKTLKTVKIKTLRYVSLFEPVQSMQF